MHASWRPLFLRTPSIASAALVAGLAPTPQEAARTQLERLWPWAPHGSPVPELDYLRPMAPVVAPQRLASGRNKQTKSRPLLASRCHSTWTCDAPKHLLRSKQSRAEQSRAEQRSLLCPSIIVCRPLSCVLDFLSAPPSRLSS